MTSKSFDGMWKKANELLENGQDEKAIKLFTNISNAGDWSGSYMLGNLYQQRGMAYESASDISLANHKESLKWFEKSLRQHDQYLAHYGIAKYYYYGFGGEKDYEKAYEHLSKSISSELFDEEQVTLAYVMMGELLWLGEGCNKDISKSKKYFIMATKLGYPAGYVGLKSIAINENRYILAFLYYLKSLSLSVKLYLSDNNHPHLSGIGGKWGDYRIAGRY